jgi:hypothetical protein
MLKQLVLLFAALCCLHFTAAAQDSKEPYSVSVWARALFGTDGKLAHYTLVNEDLYPAKFAENVKLRVARASIKAPEVDGQSVTFRTGVELRFTVTPTAEGGTVRLDGLSMGPIPVKKFLASYPQDIAQTGGWQGEATGLCKIGIDGRCTAVEVNTLPGMPESVRRHVRVSLEGWEFEPQQVAGRPIEGEFKLALRYNTLDNAPEDFRQDKFLRAIRNR